jgi:hypothetical protein
MTAGTGVLLVLIGGGAAGIAALTKQEPRVVTAMGRETDAAAHAAGTGAAPVEPADLAAVPPATDRGFGAARDAATTSRNNNATTTTGRRTSNEADRTATREPRTTGTAKADPAAGHVAGPKPAAAAATPAVTSQTETETREIPYQTQLVRDPAMPPGSRRVQAAGIPGLETLRYLVTYAGGQETERRLLDSTVTRAPQHRVIAFGSQGRPGRDHPRECSRDLGHCLLGRRACLEPAGDPVPTGGTPVVRTAPVPQAAPAERTAPAKQTAPIQQAAPPVQKAQSGAVRLGGPLALTDRDLALLDSNDLDSLDGLALDPGLAC